MNEDARKIIQDSKFTTKDFSEQVKKELAFAKNYSELIYTKMYNIIVNRYVEIQKEKVLIELGIFSKHDLPDTYEFDMNCFVSKEDLLSSMASNDKEYNFRYCDFFKEINFETGRYNIAYATYNNLKEIGVDLYSNSNNPNSLNFVYPVDISQLTYLFRSDGFSTSYVDGSVKLKISEKELEKLIENNKQEKGK